MNDLKIVSCYVVELCLHFSKKTNTFVCLMNFIIYVFIEW